MATHFRIACRTIAAWLVVLVLVTAMGTQAVGAEKITLGLHLKKGQTFNLVTTMESELTQTVMGQDMNISGTTGMGYTYEIQQVDDDGTATCKVTYSAVQMRMSMQGMEVTYDSAKPSANASPLVKPLAALLGQSFSLRISPAGRVTDIQGIEAISEKILKEAEFPDPSMRPMVEQQMREQFGANSIKETVELAIGINFPDKAVDTGDSWVKHVTIARPYPMSLDNTYNLKDRKAGIATIDVVSKISTNPAGKPMQVGQMTMTYELSGDGKGQVEIDEASGWTIGARQTQQISGTIKVEGGPQGTMAIPISGKITTRVESKK